jgi:translation elongation factor EF-1alpha
VYQDIDIAHKHEDLVELKPEMQVVFVGASQCGKSTLCGQILHLLGGVKKAEINKC